MLLLLAIGLLIANAFFVAAEFALVGLRSTKIEEMIRDGSKPAERVKVLLTHLDECLSTCQVGITLCSLGLGWLGEVTFARLVEEGFKALGFTAELSVFSAHVCALVLAFLLVTFLHVVLGEQAPKIIAIQFPETAALWIAWPMRFFNRLFFPLVWVLNNATRGVLKLFGVKSVAASARVHSEEELGIILDESRTAGVVSPEERKMLERVFRFHDKTVKEIMVPRLDIVALNLRASEKDIVEMAFKEGYSRLPVYDGNLDKIGGVVYVKDLLYTIRDPQLIKVADLMREHIEVPESYSVSKLLRDFQKRRTHMAIVVDEHGATAGLLTLEDIVEEIVGEIQDEHDEEEAEAIRNPDGAWLFAGKAHLEKLREAFPGVVLPEQDYGTIGGLVMHLAGKMPKEGEHYKLADLNFSVAQRDGRRVRKVLVRRESPPPSHSPAGSSAISSAPADLRRTQ